jgi:hypothetical protein
MCCVSLRSIDCYAHPLLTGLSTPSEDLNTLARKHVAAAVSASPSKALSALEADVSELFTLGMLTLDARLRAGPEETLPARIVEQWRYFWDRILPYLEAALLPMQTDALLAGLQRRKGTPGLDVRAVALRLFRDKLVVPVAKPLAAAIIQPRVPWSEMDRKRLQQMFVARIFVYSHILMRRVQAARAHFVHACAAACTEPDRARAAAIRGRPGAVRAAACAAEPAARPAELVPAGRTCAVVPEQQAST